MNISIKKAKTNEIDRVYSLLCECGKNMYKKFNLNHWYPFMSKNEFYKIIEGKNLYVVYIDLELIATFNLSKFPRDYYYKKIWKSTSEPAIYLGQLGIDPKIQGNGIGKWCMEQIEIISKINNYNSLRFDAIETHPWLKLFYIKLGYTPCATVKTKKWPLLCFEKQLN